MIITIEEEFDKRSSEIDLTLDHIGDVIKLQSQETASNEFTLQSILFSALILMLYNQIESTALSCVEEIYDTLEEKKISFDSLNTLLKEKIISDCKKGSTSKILVGKIDGPGIAIALARATLLPDKVFSGNLDAKKIREDLALFSIIIGNPSLPMVGEDMRSVKEGRKKLAHGSSSFEKHGRSLTYEDLKRMSENIRIYMQHVIDCTKKYLEEEQYLHKGRSSNSNAA